MLRVIVLRLVASRCTRALAVLALASPLAAGGTGNEASGGTTACDAPSGRVLEVGPGKAYAVPSAAAADARDDDTIRIAAGDYIGDVATWTRARLTICGIGGKAHLYADGRSAGGKAIWVAAGDGMVVENIVFHDAKVRTKNGAGIRIEPDVSITIRGCGFFDNEDGILGGSGAGHIVIERSEFARNGYGDGQSHGLYIGRTNSLTVRHSFFHSTKIGHNLKSRARTNIIENSYFMDGADGTASYQVEFPDGGEVFLRGNLIQKGPRADNPTLVSFGAEGIGVWTVNTMTMRHNTLVSTYAGGNFVFAHAGIDALELTANLFAGKANLLAGLSLASPVLQQQSNHTVAAAALPGATDIATPGFWPTPEVSQATRIASVPDARYLHDAPAPLVSRPITGGARFIGALQAAP